MSLNRELLEIRSALDNLRKQILGREQWQNADLLLKTTEQQLALAADWLQRLAATAAETEAA